jgi:hypothetical protein
MLKLRLVQQIVGKHNFQGSRPADLALELSYIYGGGGEVRGEGAVEICICCIPAVGVV